MMRTLIAAIFAIFLLGGCAWLQQPIDPALTSAVGEAEQMRVEWSARVETLETAISSLSEQDELTPEESAVLDQMGETLEDLQTSIGEVGVWLGKADGIIDSSTTNADALMESGLTLAAAFGLPFAGLGVPLLRKWKQSTMLKLAVTNLEGRKDEDGAVDWEGLKDDNREAGVNFYLRKLRKNGA